MKRIRELPNE
jgi:hypothetical protein